ncbi:MAG: type IV secretion protein IcmC [Tatlockia sp.]|nr:type IV secretion protein IcmC [Tatlockia sp.]
MSSPNDWQGWLLQQAGVLNSIANNLLPVQRMITGAAYIIGLAFAFKAIYMLKSYGESKSMMSSSNSGLKEPIVYLLVAAIFIYFPTGLAIMLQTSFGTSSIMQYAPTNNSGVGNWFSSNSIIGRPLTIIIQTIGGIAFVRGWILIARTASSGQPPGGTGKGLMHVVGGILAMNIVATLEIINNTLYGTS